MSKAKRHTDSMDVLYRIVTAAAAATVPVFAFFTRFFVAIVDSSLFKLIASLKGNRQDDGSTLVTHSIYELAKLFSGMGKTPDFSKLPDGVAPIRTPLVCFVVFSVLTLVLALAIFLFACFSNKKAVPLFLSLGGIISLAAAFVSFNRAAGPILDGTVSLASLFQLSPLLGSLLPLVATVSLLRLGTAWYLMLFACMGIFLWSGAHLLLGLGAARNKK